MEELAKPEPIAVSTTELTFSNQISEGARQLIWHTFFESRNRGISFDAHFPWSDQKSSVICVSLERSDDALAPVISTLVILRKRLESGRDIGMIGLVCVQPEFRNQGISTLLLTHAMDRAKREGLDALLLWTQKPDVYAKVGFATDSRDLFGTVSKGARSKKWAESSDHPSVVPANSVRSGSIPPFADEVLEFCTPAARLTCCKSQQGLTLVEYCGEVNSVMQLIDSSLPDRWMLNTPEGSTLIPALVSQGYQLDLKPGAVRMSLALNPSSNLPIQNVPFLERI
jgi:GNAT superfamily N-acetyltransferase